jgi:hypothetical protein
MKILVALLVAAAVLTPATGEQPPTIDATTVFALRDSLTLLTPKPRQVSRRLADLCAMLPPPGAADAERKRAGPHAQAFVNYYVSADGEAAMAAADGSFPVGTVIVKEKLEYADRAVTAVGGMVKRAPGFDPGNGDWEYFFAERGGDFAIGRIDSCAGCHARARSADFVFGRPPAASPQPN